MLSICDDIDDICTLNGHCWFPPAERCSAYVAYMIPVDYYIVDMPYLLAYIAADCSKDIQYIGTAGRGPFYAYRDFG